MSVGHYSWVSMHYGHCHLKLDDMYDSVCLRPRVAYLA